MANLENQFKLSQIAAQGAESRKTKEFEQQLDYTTQSGASANRLSGITKVLKTVPTTKGSAAISDMITQITNNPDLKQSVKDGYLEQLNTLLNTYKYAEANKDKGNLIVSINRSMGKGYNTSLSDFLEANPLTLMSSGQIAQIEVRSKTSGSGKESKTPDQIREEERAKTQGDLDAKAQLFKDNPDLAKLLYGKSSSGGAGADAGATPEQIKAMQDMLNKGPK
jgi:hypothetical protein